MGVDWNTFINGGQICIVEYCLNPTYAEYFDEKKGIWILKE
jgi:hypothetical protein